MNNFTAETRRQLKREQKARVMENLGRCIGIQLMYLVPYVLLMVILYVSVFGRAFALIAGGVSVNDYQLMAALSRGSEYGSGCALRLCWQSQAPCSSVLCTFTSVSHTARM